MSYTVRQPKSGEEIVVCNIVARSFNEFIAPEFTEEGIEEFFKYANPREFKRRSDSGYFSLIAESDSDIVGVVEINNSRHISMLFVEKDYHKKGIAKSLIKNAFEELKAEKKRIDIITVNSSRYAVTFYEKLGFIQYDEEKTIYGVIHIPMMAKYSELKEKL